jgi:hypothetical protein
MMEPTNSLNPFANAKTHEEREKVWSSLKSISRPVSKEEGERLLKEALRLQQADKK